MAIRGISWAQPVSIFGAVTALWEHAKQHPEEIAYARMRPEEEFVNDLIDSVGRWMIAKWRLFPGGGPLAYEFERLGITQGYDMAQVLLSATWAWIVDGKFRYAEAVGRVHAYWEQINGEPV